MNHRTKFDATSFILGGEIRNRTSPYTHMSVRPSVCLSFCLSVRLFSFYLLNRLIYECVCVFVMTIACLGLKVKIIGQS